MKTKTNSLFVAVLSLLITVALTYSAAAQSLSANGIQWQVHFEDDFDGSSINDSIWNTEVATSGKRWCQSVIPGNSPPWAWQDIEMEPWMSVTETSPYGSIAVGGGLASFSAGMLRAFPYIWCGPPSRSSPFPASGDFIFEFRWRLDSPGAHGNGVITPFWPNTEPEGDNNPWPLNASTGLWGSISEGWYWGVIGPGEVIPVLDPQEFHTFRVEYINGAYSQYVDGILSAGPTELGWWRPNAIWIGNPVFAWWSRPGDDWSDFTIDYIRVWVPRGCPNASFADDAVIWHQPLARNGASEDTDPSEGKTMKYRFKRGSTIPIQIHTLDCAGADVTSNANVIGTVTVFGDSSCSVATDGNGAPIDFNGVGGNGGVMDKVGGHLKYNLDTKSLPTTTQCFILRVTVTDTSSGEEKIEEVLLEAK
jgi:hypothetical protein